MWIKGVFMTFNILIKTKPKRFELGAQIEIRAIFEHPMKSGLGKDENGKRVQPHFIKKVWVYYDNELLNELEMTGAVSSNPFMSFALVVDQKSAPLRISWLDNLGDTNEKEIALEAI